MTPRQQGAGWVLGRKERPRRVGRPIRIALESLEDRRVPALGLDPTFGAAGLATLPIDIFRTSALRDSVVQPDGKIVAVGLLSGPVEDVMIVSRLLPNGTLDPTFSGDGLASLPLGGLPQEVNAVRLQSDGRILVAGAAQGPGGDTDFFVARFNPDGTPDATFGSGGAVVSRFEAGTTRLDRATSLAIQADGKIVVGGQLQIFDQNTARFAAARLNTNGTLDTTFDSDGVTTFSFPGGTNRLETEALAVEIQTDGRIVLAGKVQVVAGNTDFAAARLNTNGTLDTTFGVNGLVTVPLDQAPGINRDGAADLIIRPTGQIVLVGFVQKSADVANGDYDFAIVQLTSNGARDTTFGNVPGNPGVSLVDFVPGPTSTDLASSAALLSDGRILVGGTVRAASGGLDFGVARLTTAGTLDNTFDGDGRAIIAFDPPGSTTDQLSTLALQPDGRILLAGSIIDTTTEFSRFGFAQLTTNGLADGSFGSGGKVRLNLTASGGSVTAMATQPADGKVLLANQINQGGESLVTITRATPNGSPDPTFGLDGSGVALVDLVAGAEVSVPRALAVQTDGKILIAGSTRGTGASAANDFFVARLTTSGALDSGFGTGGVVIIPFNLGGTNADEALSLLLQTDGKIVVGGSAATASGPLFALARLDTNGTLDTTFDTDGRLTISSASFGFGAARALAQSGGAIFAAGSVSSISGGQADLGVAKFLSNGSLDTSFSSDGLVKLVFDLGGPNQDEQVAAVAVDSTGKIIVFGDSSVGGTANRDLVVARLSTSGDLDPSFDGDGLVVIPVDAGGGNIDRAAALTVLPSDRLALLGTADRGGTRGTDLVFARLLVDGQLDTTVGTGGTSTVFVGFNAGSSNNDLAIGVASATGGRFLLGGSVTSDVPPGGALGGLARLQEDATPPVLNGFSPVVPNPRNQPVLSIDVSFSSDIDLNTFTLSDLALTRNGTGVLLTSPASIFRVSTGLYRIAGLQSFTQAEGNYILSLNGANVQDSAGNAATGTAQVSFTVTLTGPVALSVAAVSPNPRPNDVSFFDVSFSAPINTSSFTSSDLTLTRGGTPVPINGPGTVALVNGATNTYRISGLSFTPVTGSYQLTVSGAGITDALGNAGSGSPTVSFVIDATAPVIVGMEGAPSGQTKFPVQNPLIVRFSEDLAPGANLPRSALTLRRNGAVVGLTNAVTITRQDARSFRIDGLIAFTRPNGTYSLTVNPGSVTDLVGNPGSPSAADTITWERRGIILGDYDGDGIVDLATYVFDTAANQGRFNIRHSSKPVGQQDQTVLLGVAGVIPIAGDFDGDGITDVAVYDPNFASVSSPGFFVAAWSWIRSSDQQFRRFEFGGAGTLDRPAPGDFDGDGITDFATFRANSDITPGAAEWFMLRSKDGPFRLPFGAANGVDLPAVADFDNDFKDDIATFRPVPHPLDVERGIVDAAQWFIIPSSRNGNYTGPIKDAFPVVFGAAGNADQPAVADFDGDGRADITAFRSVSDIANQLGKTAWFIVRSSANSFNYTPKPEGGLAVFYGQAGEIAAVGDYDGDGRPDMAVYNANLRRWTIRTGVSAPDRQITFPAGNSTTAVPVLAPLFFRLQATGNPTGAGGNRSASLLAGSAGGAGTSGFRSLGGLAGFGLASAEVAGGAGSTPKSSSRNSTDGWADAVDRVLDDLA